LEKLMHVQITAVFDAPVAAAGGKHTPRIGFGFTKVSRSRTRWPKSGLVFMLTL